MCFVAAFYDSLGRKKNENTEYPHISNVLLFYVSSRVTSVLVLSVVCDDFLMDMRIGYR